MWSSRLLQAYCLDRPLGDSATAEEHRIPHMTIAVVTAVVGSRRRAIAARAVCGELVTAVLDAVGRAAVGDACGGVGTGAIAAVERALGEARAAHRRAVHPHTLAALGRIAADVAAECALDVAAAAEHRRPIGATGHHGRRRTDEVGTARRAPPPSHAAKGAKGGGARARTATATLRAVVHAGVALARLTATHTDRIGVRLGTAPHASRALAASAERAGAAPRRADEALPRARRPRLGAPTGGAVAGVDLDQTRVGG